MSALKLSIIIPVYNVEKYLEKCLNSLCGLKIENEIIIINDGTKDSSLEIAEKFKKNHKNENILIISQENQGLSEARNNGMKIAKGEYISFIDSDDFVDTGNYEKFVNDFVKKNSDQSLSIDFNIKNIDEDIAYIIFSITMNNKK